MCMCGVCVLESNIFLLRLCGRRLVARHRQIDKISDPMKWKIRHGTRIEYDGDLTSLCLSRDFQYSLFFDEIQ